MLEKIYKFIKYCVENNERDFHLKMQIKIDYLNNKIKELEKQLSDEKIAHTKTAARIVYAQHILSCNREDKVKEFWQNNLEYVNEYNR
jgi:hypothetical protein